MNTLPATEDFCPPLRILCADDSAANRSLLAGILRRKGYRVTCVRDGGEAFDVISGCPDYFDLLITDHDMPGMNGLELVIQLRQTPFQGRIILNSATVTTEDLRYYQRESVEALLHKPVNPATLLALVERCRTTETRPTSKIPSLRAFLRQGNTTR